MIQNYIGIFLDFNAINAKVAEINSCPYCECTDIRIIPYEYASSIKAQIIYNYDIDKFNEDMKKE